MKTDTKGKPISEAKLFARKHAPPMTDLYLKLDAACDGAEPFHVLGATAVAACRAGRQLGFTKEQLLMFVVAAFDKGPDFR